jgi:hypothetical protein
MTIIYILCLLPPWMPLEVNGKDVSDWGFQDLMSVLEWVHHSSIISTRPIYLLYFYYYSARLLSLLIDKLIQV